MTSEIKEDVDYEVSDSVLAKVVKMAALEVPGVVAISTAFVNLGKKAQGITVKNDGGKLVIDVHIIGSYGGNLRDLARKVQMAVTQAISQMVDPVSLTVNVFLEDIVVKQDNQ